MTPFEERLLDSYGNGAKTPGGPPDVPDSTDVTRSPTLNSTGTTEEYLLCHRIVGEYGNRSRCLMWAGHPGVCDSDPESVRFKLATDPGQQSAPPQVVDLEVQVLRDGLPLTRPTRWSGGLKSFVPGEVATFKAFPGSFNSGEVVNVTVYHAGMMTPDWLLVQALIAIDGVPWPSPMPAQVFLNPGDAGVSYDGWSAVINFPIMSHLPGLRGVHSLLIRTVRCKEVTR